MLTILCALAVTQANPADAPNCTVYAHLPQRLQADWLWPSFVGVSPIVYGQQPLLGAANPANWGISTLAPGQAPPGWSPSAWAQLHARTDANGGVSPGASWRVRDIARRLQGAPQ